MPIRARRRWLSILSITAALLVAPLAAHADDVRIRASVANVRAEASGSSRVLFQVKAGDVLRLLAISGDWLHVEATDGRRGYVSKALGDVIASAPAGRTAAPASPPAAGSLAIDHKEVACIVGDRYPRLDACFQPAGELGNAKVLFRASDKSPWYAVDLMPEGNCHIAYLPKPLATTTEIQYYVAAVDRSFNERQQPETAPETAYRARVVKNQGDCDRLKRVAASVATVAKPIVVAAGRTGGGAPVALTALIVGFSQEGVVMAGVAAAGAAGAAGGAAAAAGAGAGAGSGGGIGTTTLAIAGGAVAAAAVVAVTRGGGDDEPSCSAADIAAQGQGNIILTDNQTICSSPSISCGRPGLTLRTCLSGVCSSSCSLYYELSDNRRFPCAPLGNCLTGANAVTDPNFCLAAAQQVVQACQ
jgi:hypothetical protein